MPGIIQETPFKTITVKELHPTFGAEIIGVNFPNPDEEQYREVLAALAKYGFCAFRNTGMDDADHVAFSRRFGDLDDIRPYMTGGRKPRYEFYELFDASNLDQDGGILDPNSQRSQYNKGNGLFHVDSSFNPRRASFSMLRAVELPPPGTGGNTDFADSRTAFDELPEALKEELLRENYVGAHCLAHSRKTAAPEYFKDLDPTESKMHLHRLVQKHEPSGRNNLYIAAHCHHIEGMDPEKSKELLSTLMNHVTQKKYTVTVPWFNPSDLVIWDNTCVMHRAAGGEFEGKYRRDLRRTTVHDSSPTAWGLNEAVDSRQGFKRSW
ncbi:alpha-ketoglutarate-dependent 2,4-dichlorophenoxyacetate dioxygenase [Rhizodiscina lignyota]|uniref:Alpha-ketoglutarate-dependent 2,4-dichlorophenoxyacetate dioxygenase n=1 Tax=Rhizodiscina lignyota TaxID=1504668 RepID=A0A9P4M5N7_9PEZI|nr:alpha-ketoglutarate-dependent 2,4-dichlorophenoxyacetate dioxygenase [Rhizodiscina lignyota]